MVVLGSKQPHFHSTRNAREFEVMAIVQWVVELREEDGGEILNGFGRFPRWWFLEFVKFDKSVEEWSWRRCGRERQTTY